MQSPVIDRIPDLYDVRFLTPSSGRQSDESFSARVGTDRQIFNIHDYDTLYQVPWLYDVALYRALNCRTPSEMAEAIRTVWRDHGVDPTGLSALELGAGSGAFGMELKETVGVGAVDGLDLSPHAAEAAGRDRPGIYRRYHVADLTALDPETDAALKAARYDMVAVASATGWGNHIPIAGFERAFDLLRPGGWFVFHVKPNDPDPECIALVAWIEDKISSGRLDLHYRQPHYHRQSSAGGDIFYDVVIGTCR